MMILQARRSRWLALAIGIAMFGLAVGKVTAPVAAADTATKQKVDLNSASEKDLQELPGVGEATANKIIAGRPYKSIAPALAKAGLNDAEIAKLKGLVTFTEPKAETKAADKTTDKKSDKMTDKAKAADNGTMAANKSKIDTKSGKDAKAKSTDKPADKMFGAAEPAGPKVDLNTASQKDIEMLPGIGEATAKKIVDGRPYKSLQGLTKVGVTEVQITRIKPLVIVTDAKVAAKADSKMADAEAKSGKKSDKMASSAKSAKKEKDKTTELSTPPPTDKEIKDATAKKLVWANLNSKVYHEPGDHWYGKTHHGKFMTEDEAKKEGYTRAHMNENSDALKGGTT